MKFCNQSTFISFLISSSELHLRRGDGSNYEILLQAFLHPPVTTEEGHMNKKPGVKSIRGTTQKFEEFEFHARTGCSMVCRR
jgi:hypothetical protein